MANKLNIPQHAFYERIRFKTAKKSFRLESYDFEPILSLIFSLVFIATGSVTILAELPTWRIWNLRAIEKWLMNSPKTTAAEAAVFVLLLAIAAFQTILVFWKWARSRFPTNLTVGNVLLSTAVSVSLLSSLVTRLDGPLLLSFYLLLELAKVPSLVGRLWVTLFKPKLASHPKIWLLRVEEKMLILHCGLFLVTRFLAFHFFNAAVIPFAKSILTKLFMLLVILISLSSAIYNILSTFKKTTFYNLFSLL